MGSGIRLILPLHSGTADEQQLRLQLSKVAVAVIVEWIIGGGIAVALIVASFVADAWSASAQSISFPNPQSDPVSWDRNVSSVDHAENLISNAVQLTGFLAPHPTEQIATGALWAF